MEDFHLFPNCIIDNVEVNEQRLVISLRRQNTTASCPYCHHPSSRTHGHYTRHPRDLPIGQHQVCLQLRVRRFCCQNQACDYQTFGESFECLINRYGQRSQRLCDAHTKVAISLGGEAGSALLTELNMPVSADSLLRGIEQQAPRVPATPRVLGVDDWAVKRRHSYGTILVDLEKRQVVDLLEGRDAQTLAQWLELHPGVEIISRDRSHDYAKAAREAAPDAVQVADRWHLLHNLRQMLEKWLRTILTKLARLPFSDDMKRRAEALFKPRFVSRMTKADEASSQASLERRTEHYRQVKELHEAGMGLLPISKKLGINRQTVRAYAYADAPPRRRQDPRPASILDPYLAYMEERLDEGCENASLLWREIVEQGYPGKSWQVHKWMQGRRTKPSKHAYKQPRLPKPEDVNMSPAKFLPSAKQLAWLLSKTAGLSDQEILILDYVCQDEKLNTMRKRTHSFKDMIVQRKPEAFDSWLDEGKASGITALRTFTDGLRQDYDAVKAAMTLVWSNGQVEGKVTKLKLIKRQMYGRAGFELLRKRVLLAT